MLNEIRLMGRLAENAVVKQTDIGSYVISFILAVERNRKNIKGQKDADFIEVITDITDMERFEYKYSVGDILYVSGRLQTNIYENKDGIKLKSYIVVASTVRIGDRRCGSKRNKELRYEDIKKEGL